VIELDPQALAGVNCTADFAWLDEPILTINQSGQFVDLSFNDVGQTNLAGRIHETVITAQVPTGRNTPAVPVSGQPAYLRAAVDRELKPEQLIGSLQIVGCADPVPFIATGRTSSSEITGEDG
jgi:hypothetical protein